MNQAQKKSFLFATWEGGGSVAPALTVAQRMIERGHRVRVMSDACNRFESEAIGATFVPYVRAPSKESRAREHDKYHDWAHEDPLEGFLNVMDNVLTGPAQAFAEDVIAELQREPADLVVSSEMLFGVHLGCEAIGQKFVLLGSNIALFPIEGMPIMGPGLPPPRTPEEHAAHAEIFAATVAAMDTRLPAFNAARAAYGLAPLQTLMQQHDRAERLLLATSAAFDFAPDVIPAHVAYIGPQLADPAWAAPWTSLFASDRAGRKRVLVSFSTTFQNHVGALQRVIDAIADLPLDAVVTLGEVISADELRAPGNVTLVRSAPHGAAMDECDIVVTHGGHGTVMKALVRGKPMLLVPHGRDQNDNAVRITERGAGLVVPQHAPAAEMRAALARLIAEPAFTEAARALGAKVAHDMRASPVAEMLEVMATPAPRERCAA